MMIVSKKNQSFFKFYSSVHRNIWLVVKSAENYSKALNASSSWENEQR